MPRPRLYDVATHTVKILADPEHLAEMRNGPTWPRHLCVLVTTRCQLRCPFCSVVNRAENRDMDFDLFRRLVGMGRTHGVRAIEFTGGDCLLWPHFDDAMRLCRDVDMRTGVQTNGLAIPAHVKTLALADWIRVGVYSPGQLKKLRLDTLPDGPTMGISMVWTAASTEEWLDTFRAYAVTVGASYARVMLDHFDLRPELKQSAECAIRRIGSPLILSDRQKGVPPTCMQAYWKAAVDYEGYFYACGEIGGQGHGDLPRHLRTCHIDNAEAFYAKKPHDLGHRCETCGYAENNAIFHAAMQRPKHLEFK